MGNTESDSVSASLYDYFYYDHTIISKLLDLNDVENFLKRNDIKLEETWKAYLYTIELSLTDLFDRIESFINNYLINRFLTDYEGDFPEYTIKNYLEKDPYIKRIYLLDGIRKELMALRNNKDFERENILNLFKKLKEAIDETDIFITKEYKVKRVNSDSNAVNNSILNYIINIYGYVRYTNIPLSPFFRTLPRNKVLIDYTSKRLKNPKQYVQGYVLFFFYLCENFGASINYNIKDTVNNLNELRGLHDIGSKIYDDSVRDLGRFIIHNIFEMTEKPIIRVKYFNNAITRPEQLEFLLGNCDVKIINPKEFFGKGFFSGGETKTDDLLLTILHGELSRLKIGEKLEIIRFSHYIKEKMEDTWYSYAFYMNPGYWLIFDGVGYDTSRLRYQLDSLLESNKEKIEYTKLKIKDRLLREYYKERDRDIRFRNYEKGLEGNMLGLLTEFAAVVYLLKCRNANITGIRSNTSNTDVDVEAVKENQGFIVQAKKSLPVEKVALNKAIKEINEHFKKLENYKVNGNKPIKILFFIGWRYPSGEEEPEAVIQTRRLFLLKELRKNNISLAPYSDLDFILTSKKENNLNGIIKKVLGFQDGFIFS